MLDETSGFFIIVVLVAILLLWPTLSSCRGRYGGGCPRKGPCMMHPMYIDGLESKSAVVAAPGGMSYNELIKNEALEKSVFESHNRFTTDAPHRTTVSSTDTVRDDPNDVNPRVGLRLTQYRNPVASDQKESRVVASESPSQMPEYKPFML